MKSKNQPSIIFLRVLLSAMIGLMCALFAVIASNIVFILWDSLVGLPDAGSAGNMIFDLQRLALFLVFAAMAGVLSTLNLNKTIKDVLVSGGIAGASLAILLFLPLVLLVQNPSGIYDKLFTSLPPYLLSSNVQDYSGTFQQNLNLVAAHTWLAMLLMFLGATVIAAGVASRLPYANKGKVPKKFRMHAIAVTGLALVVMVIPVIAAAAGIGAGVISHPTAINYAAILSVNESVNDSVAGGGNNVLDLTVLKSPGGKYIESGRPFTVLINGKDATNQSIATVNGIPVTIDPSGGIVYEEGSRLKIRNLKSSDTVEIIANYRDGVNMTLTFKSSS